MLKASIYCDGKQIGILNDSRFFVPKRNSIPSASVRIDYNTSGRGDHWLLNGFPLGTITRNSYENTN